MLGRHGHSGWMDVGLVGTGRGSVWTLSVLRAHQFLCLTAVGVPKQARQVLGGAWAVLPRVLVPERGALRAARAACQSVWLLRGMWPHSSPLPVTCTGQVCHRTKGRGDRQAWKKAQPGLTYAPMPECAWRP